MEKGSLKTLVVFDSIYGNTKKIAEAIANELGKDVKAILVADFNAGELKGGGLLVVGSPIIGWKPSEKMGAFLAGLAKDQLKGYRAIAFDTRVKMFIHGDAAGKISQALKNAGAEIIGKPQAFYVQGKEGPLFEGEIEKAKAWVKEIKSM